MYLTASSRRDKIAKGVGIYIYRAWIARSNCVDMANVDMDSWLKETSFIPDFKPHRSVFDPT